MRRIGPLHAARFDQATRFTRHQEGVKQPLGRAVLE